MKKPVKIGHSERNALHVEHDGEFIYVLQDPDSVELDANGARWLMDALAKGVELLDPNGRSHHPLKPPAVKRLEFIAARHKPLYDALCESGPGVVPPITSTKPLFPDDRTRALAFLGYGLILATLEVITFEETKRIITKLLDERDALGQQLTEAVMKK